MCMARGGCKTSTGSRVESRGRRFMIFIIVIVATDFWRPFPPPRPGLFISDRRDRQLARVHELNEGKKLVTGKAPFMNFTPVTGEAGNGRRVGWQLSGMTSGLVVVVVILVV